mmetsp:Transcript_18652/g.26315  ORF Transcript_18652/g.26315 Transcript_18652/m.26315 type:complete len:278 (+) Transcript_18652:65-898(+)
MGWLEDYIPSKSPPPKNNDDNGSWIPATTMIQKYVNINDLQETIHRHYNASTPFQWGMLITCCTTSFVVGYRVGRMKSTVLTRFTSVSDIPSSYFGSCNAKDAAAAPILRGRVVSVSDGDTIRFLHVPTWFHSSKIPKDEKMSSVALPIRICTIDTPETSKFGKPGQPFGEEAKQKLQSLVDNKMVSIQLLQKDQYSRAVAQVQCKGGFLGLFTKYVDEEMLKAGLAEVYQGSGAVYGHLGKQAYLDMEGKARKAKKGLWSQGDARESAAEYKARTK